MSVGRAIPLLKFTQSEKGHLADEGIEKLKSLPSGGVLVPIIFIGDGRGGKSYMASRLVGDSEAFASSDSAEPVTEGIDFVVTPLQPLLAEVGIPLQKGGEDTRSALKEEHLLVLDCEGGNNAMAAIRTLVNVFGLMIGTQVCFVASGMASEQALQALGGSLAASSLINLDGEKIPSRGLHFVVNKNTLKYNDDALESMLEIKDSLDDARKEVRQSIKDSFAEREFHSIPMMGMPNFEDSVKKLRKNILSKRKTLTMGGAPISGEACVGLLQLIVKEIHASNQVSFPSMHRYVILDGFLIPTVYRIADEYVEAMPDLQDYDEDLDSKNEKNKFIEEFNDTVSYIGQPTLVSEARQQLIEKLENAWDQLARKNRAFGEQVKEMGSETREVQADAKMGAIGGRGMLKNVVVTMQKMKVESRAVIHRKRGGAPELGPWMDTGSSTTRIAESAFESYGQLPVLRGKLFKRSPNVLRTIFGKKQERPCILKDGHFIWWSPDKMQAKGEASGAINFLINRAKVVADDANPGAFIIKPASDSGWKDITSFSGGEQREFMFDAAECDVGVNEWIAGIKLHIEFANQAFQQLGEAKILEQVGVYKPTFAQVDA
mmetsp:Transcript_15524/g.24594  ORF Transcript_15524/g.24594 Transcript_15524/m.24594 type:complete len:604 (-) Transcript_15524:194-2005(-)